MKKIILKIILLIYKFFIEINYKFVMIYTFSIIAGIFVLFFSYYFIYKKNMPHVDKWPMFFAPAFTLIMGIIACVEQLRLNSNVKLKDNRIMWLNFIAIILIIGLCFTLSAPMNAFCHVLIVFFLFIFFNVWDRLMIIWLGNYPEFAEEIRRIRLANKLINIPTLIGFFIIIALIYLHTTYNDGHPFIDVVQNIFGQDFTDKLRQKHKLSLISTEAELFVSGVIAFHLVTVAIAFFIATHMRLGLEKGKEDTQKTSNG